jgi:signal transduction histidine kinase
VQQQLIALAVNLQLAEPLLDEDPAAARVALDDLRRDVHRALEEAAQLAARIYPPLLQAAGLGAALRSAAATSGSVVSVDVAPGVRYPPEVTRTVYLCCLEAFGGESSDLPASVTVRGDEEMIAFEIIGSGVRPDAWIGGLRDRVEALGGTLTVTSEPDGETHVSGSLPVSR